MKLTHNLLNFLLLLILLTNNSYAKESCKGGFCIISLDSLDKGEKLKKIKPSTIPSIKSKKINKKIEEK